MYGLNSRKRGECECCSAVRVINDLKRRHARVWRKCDAVRLWWWMNGDYRAKL
jgi:hypothetical protein